MHVKVIDCSVRFASWLLFFQYFNVVFSQGKEESLMRKMWMPVIAAAAGVAIVGGVPVWSEAHHEGGKCYECHEEVKTLKEKSKHGRLECSQCHEKTAEHLKDNTVKPVTRLSPETCGKCHKDQYDSFFKVSHESGARKEKGIALGRSPLQDKLLSPHGFTMEHNEPRAHPYMVVDQFIVDRFSGGRFQLKNMWQMDATGKTWDIIEDTGKDLPLTAKAGNPTCIQCKSSDHILKWKFMGDKGGQWDRGSDVIAVAKDTVYPMGCIHCHDPHGTQPRVIRDALIQAVNQDRAGNIFARNGQTDMKVIDFRGFRKIGVLSKSDSRLLCAQCHVEYNCNPGSQWTDGEKVTFADARTNHFPLKSAKDILQHYKTLNFFDFKHEITGARLVKLQHPEAETYAGSVHDRAGITCADCHMPKMKKGKKTFTSHSVIKPKNDPKAACLRCHPKSNPDQLKYMIDGTINYTKGKMRKAEYWLGRLIDTYAIAKRAGVDESVLAQARAKHEEAHVLWEWWTAENSDGWHNPPLARETLTASVAASKEGVKILNDGMSQKK